MKTILLVGKRTDAIKAVKALGYKAQVIEVSSRPEQAAHAFGGRLEEAHTITFDETPSAIIGVAEGSVPTAAFLRERLGLPGISSRASHVAHDKLAMKRAIVASGIPCADWAEVTAETTVDDLVAQLGFPLVLKVPVSSGGRGVRVCHNHRELSTALAPGLLAEAFIHGTEMSIESFMLGKRTLLRNHTRYVELGRASIIPAGLSSSDVIAVNALADRVHEALELGDGMTHMEIFLTESGPVFGEIAARPPGGRLMNLLSMAYHFNPWEALIQLALGQDPMIPTTSNCFAGVFLLYPDPGTILAIRGIHEAAEIPGITEVRCHAKVGDQILPRIGTGQIKGHILASDNQQNACETLLRKAYSTIHFDMDAQTKPTHS